jgi:hypothetical protein
VSPSQRQLDKRCLCGSGKAFKNCHGQEYLAKRAPRIPRYLEQEDPYIDPPGYTYLTQAFLFEDEDEPKTSPFGEPGGYEATFTLLQPGQVAERVKGFGTTRVWEVQNERIAGDSHLAICMPKDAQPSPNAEMGVAMPISINRPDGSASDMDVVLKPNPDGRLAKVLVSLEAESFNNAEKRAYFEASSILSDLSFKLDLPLRIAHTHLKEISSGHVRIGFVRQFPYRGMGNLPEFEKRDETSAGFTMGMKGSTYAALTSIYREALNTESPYYQFLCFCRIIQRLKTRLRPKWKKIILEHDKGLVPTYQRHEKFQEAQEDEHFPAEILGKKFNAVYDDYLTPLRDGIAHVFLEDMKDERSAERSTDEHEFVSEVYVHLPVAHHIARTMLSNDFKRGGLAELVSRCVGREDPSREGQCSG